MKKQHFYLFLFFFTYLLYGQQINDEFYFKGNLKAESRAKYLTKLLSNSGGSFIQDYVKVGSKTQQVYNKSQANDGLVYTIDDINNFKDYTYNVIYYMPAYTSYNRIQMFGNLEGGVYRYGTGLYVYGSGINDRPSLLPKSGYNYTHIGISRKASTNTVRIYINGDFYKEYTNTSDALKIQSDKKFTFFKDNGGEENVAKVAYINVANYIQTADEIRKIFEKATNPILEESYLFLNNLNNTDNSSNLSNSSTTTFGQVYDPSCQVNRNALLINSNNDLTFKNKSQSDLNYTFIFKIKPSSSSNNISLIDFSNDGTNRKISLVNNKLYFGGNTSNITLNRQDENSWIDLAITRNDSDNKINIYSNNILLGTYLDSDKIFKFLDTYEAKICKVNDNSTTSLALFKYTNEVYTLDKIKNEFTSICNVTIDNTYLFNQTLNNLSNTNPLIVSSVDNSHSSNNYSNNVISNCNTSAYTYNANPKSKIKYNNGYGMYYYNFTLKLYFHNNNTSSIKLISFDDSAKGIYQNGNQLLVKTSINDYTFNIPAQDSQEFNLLSFIKDGSTKEIKVYADKIYLGTVLDINNDIAINANGDVYLLNNINSALTNIKIKYFNISNSIKDLDDIKLTLNEFCPKIVNESFEFNGNLSNQTNTKNLNFVPSLDSYNVQNFYSDKNTNCGDRKVFYTLNQGEGFIYEDEDYFVYNKFTISLYFKVASKSDVNQLINFGNNNSITYQNDRLYFSPTSNNLSLSSLMIHNYNLLTIVKNPGVLQIYMNGNFVGQIADPNNNFSFTKQSPLTFFNDKKAFVGEIKIENRAFTSTEIINNYKNLCVRKVNRTFPMFMNLKDSTGENELVPTSYVNQHLDNKFIKDEVINCGVSRTVYFVADNAGLIFNDGVGELYNDYTISLYFRLNPYLGGWARLIDFSDGESDAGIYRLSNGLNFYPNGNVGNDLLSNSHAEYTYLTLSRNSATNIITVYINGKKYLLTMIQLDYIKFQLMAISYLLKTTYV